MQAVGLLGLSRGTPEDKREGYKWLEKAGEAGEARSAYEAGRAIYDGEESVCEKDEVRGLALLTKAAKQDEKGEEKYAKAASWKVGRESRSNSRVESTISPPPFVNQAINK